MCNIVISDGVESPIISEANIMLIFDERSLGDYQELMDPDGTDPEQLHDRSGAHLSVRTAQESALQ